MINSDKYCFQMDRLQTVTDEKNLELGRCCLPSGQCQTSCFFADSTTWLGCSTSPAVLTFSDHLFQSLQISVNKKFNSLETCKENHLNQFINQTNPKLWEGTIIKLHLRWRKVVEQNDKNLYSYT